MQALPSTAAPAPGMGDSVKSLWSSAKRNVVSMPGRFLTAMLVVLVLMIVFFVWWMIERKKKEGFMNESPYLSGLLNHTSNWATGSNSPQWQFGGENAGAGGSMETAWTDYHNVFRASAFDPDVRGALYGGTYPTSYPTDGAWQVQNGQYVRAGFGPKEGMGNPTDPSSMLTHETTMPLDKSCRFGELCNPVWGPNATAEAQVLATAGALEGYDYGNYAIQNAINQTEAASVGYSDNQLHSMLHA